MSINVYLPGPHGIYMDVAEVRIGRVKMKRPFKVNAMMYVRMVCEGYWWREATFKVDGLLLMCGPDNQWYARHFVRVEDPPED